MHYQKYLSIEGCINLLDYQTLKDERQGLG